MSAEFAVTHDAAIRNAGGIRPGVGCGEAEARYFLATRQPRQVLILLRVGAVAQQQLGGSERIRHHDGDAGGDGTRRDLHHHRRVRQRREFQAAVLLRDDHAKEAIVLDELPHLRRQIIAHVRNVPVVEHAAQLIARPVEERLFFGTEPCLRYGLQFLPAWRAIEQLRLPPHRAGFQRLALGIRHGRHDALEQREYRARQQPAAQRRNIQQQREHAEDRPQSNLDGGRHGAEVQDQAERQRGQRRPQPERGAVIGKPPDRCQCCQCPYKTHRAYPSLLDL